jgi:hypothetical protein
MGFTVVEPTELGAPGLSRLAVVPLDRQRRQGRTQLTMLLGVEMTPALAALELIWIARSLTAHTAQPIVWACSKAAPPAATNVADQWAQTSRILRPRLEAAALPQLPPVVVPDMAKLPTLVAAAVLHAIGVTASIRPIGVLTLRATVKNTRTLG